MCLSTVVCALSIAPDILCLVCFQGVVLHCIESRLISFRSSSFFSPLSPFLSLLSFLVINKWKPSKNILLPAALKRKRAISDLAAKNAALKARLHAQRASKGKGAASSSSSSSVSTSRKGTIVTATATMSQGPAPNSIAAIAAGTASAAAVAVEFEDEYDPFRPNDFEEWEMMLSRDERARRDREQRKELFKATETITQKSRNTAAFAPPQALLHDTVVSSKSSSNSGSGGGGAGAAFAPPSNYGPASSTSQNNSGDANNFKNDDGDDEAHDPFASMPVTGYSGSGSSGGGGPADADSDPSDPFASLPVTGYSKSAGGSNGGGSKGGGGLWQKQPEPTLAGASSNVSGDDAYAARARLRGGDETHPARASQLNHAAATPTAAAAAATTTTAAAAAATSASSAPPSRVLLLTNMVGPADDLTDLDDETATECSEKYGTVVSCKVHLEPRDSCAPEEAVRIFIEFARQDSATKALSHLNGRKFADRLVRANYFDLAKFKRAQFAR